MGNPTIESPTCKATELHYVENCTSSDPADVLRSVGGDKHLRTDGVADAVGDEDDGGGDGLLGSTGDVRGQEGPYHYGTVRAFAHKEA
jgi:hypothetical protein